MEIHFHGGTREVTGALYRVVTENTQFIVDCGILQGSSFAEEHNYGEFPFDAGAVDFVIATHAHMDHIGRLPRLYRAGFRGPIYATPPTRDIADVSLHDGYHIMKEEAREYGREPLYSEKDLEECLALFTTFGYETPTEVGENITVTFRDAGHILGSAIVEIATPDGTVAFSGDIGNPPSPLLNRPATPERADAVVMESTYGDRLHEQRDERKQMIKDCVNTTVKRGGTVLIPVFAVERTQEILYELNDLAERGEIPDIPVFVDSPMAIKTTEIYRQYINYMKKEARDRAAEGDNIFDFPGLSETRTVQESKEINEIEGPKIVMAGSGMSTGGRILHHEVRYIEDPDSTLLLVGYQAPGTLGRRFMEGEKQVNVFGNWFEVNAEVRTVRGYSGHGDRDFLLEWVNSLPENTDTVFVVQGEEHAAQALAQSIRERHDIAVHVPRADDSYHL